MKKVLRFFLIATFLFSTYYSYSQISVGIINSWGSNIIDFESLMDAPYWDQDNSPYDTQITDYSRFVYKGGIQITKTVNEAFQEDPALAATIFTSLFKKIGRV